MSGPFGSSQFMYATGAAEVGQSLRFEDGDSAYMTRTPTSAGNRKTWTWSGWVKRGNISANQGIFGAESSGDRLVIGFGNSNSDQARFYSQSPAANIYTNAVFRDVSAWYHVVWAVDTTQSTAADRVKLYINGTQITSFASASYPSQNSDLAVNNTVTQYIGRWAGYAGEYLDGYLANVTFIDGTALTPTSFGEYDGTLWKPKSDADITSLTFGTNGFYLPFKQTTEAEGFSTVTYTGNGGTQSIEGVGFEPDFVWLKSRNAARSHGLFDSVRGVTKGLASESTSSEYTSSAGNDFVSFDSSGFTVGTPQNFGSTNTSGDSIVAWCWDAGSGSAVSNTDGATTSNVKANTAKGFSICTWTVGTENSTVGHGLNSAPEVILMKSRSYTLGWAVQHTGLTNMTDRVLALNTDGAEITAGTSWSAPTSTTFGTSSALVISGETWVGYCFHSVSGYSKFGTYSGTGSAGNAVTGLGFKPAFIIIKRKDASDNWVMFDNTRDPVNSAEKYLLADLSQAEATFSTVKVDFDSDGFTLQGSANSINNSSGTYIYMAFADTRDATFFGDTSGNSNNWTPNALNNTDVVPDSPVSGGNFTVMNPNDFALYLSEGNLKVSSSAGSGSIIARSTMLVPPNSGKWYFEGYNTVTSANGHYIGVWCPTGLNAAMSSGYHDDANFGVLSGHECVTYLSNGTIRNNSSSSTVTGLDDFNTAGDIVGVLLDMDAQTVQFYTNGTAQGSAQSLPNTTDPYGFFVAGHHSKGVIFNAGQDDSFAGLETPSGVSDESGTGVFSQSQGANGKAWNSGNLPAATITAPDEYFNTVLYTGTGATQSISVGWQPDWVWIKARSTTYNNNVFDSVRGVEKYLLTDSTLAENGGTSGTGSLTSFDASGFSLGSQAYINNSGTSFVAWNWLAGNGTVSNTDGSITSTVSANQTAGFSVVGYTGTGSAATVGHGLSSAPKMVIVKNRSAADGWIVWHDGLSSGTSYLLLHSANAQASNSAYFNGSPTSSVFNIGTSTNTNGSGNNLIAYCFAEVESYSKCGSYTGNGGTTNFVHCGFRPAWVMIKCIDSARDWIVFDNKRNTYNVATQYLYPNQSFAEGSSSTIVVDFLSNGFNLKGGNNVINTYNQTLIFAAFAEAPFKSANAR